MVPGRVPVQRRLSRSRSGRLRPRGSGDRPYPGRGDPSEYRGIDIRGRRFCRRRHRGDLQPVRFARSGIAARLLELLGPDTAHAEWGWVTSHPRSSGVTLAGKRVFGWAASLVDKVSAFAADHGMDIIKGAGELLSMAVGLDDFIILTKAMAALAAGATDEIETVEVCFAAAGAVLTIAEVVSLGTLAPAAESLKWGLDGFKIALKGMGPDGVKAALGMAKGLWKVIKEVATDRRAALVLVKDTSAAIVHLARNTGEEIFDVFVGVVRSPMDFMNWVKALKSSRRAAGCLTFAPGQYSKEVMVAASEAEKGGFAVMFLALMDFFVSEAEAGEPPQCELALYSLHSRILTRSGMDKAKAVQRSRALNDGMARIERDLVENKNFNLKNLLFDDAEMDGVIAMACRGKKGNHIFYIAKSVAEKAKKLNLSPAETEAIIGKYFRLIGEIDKIDDIQDANKLWGDMGKFLHKTYSDHFITGIFHQLEVMDELRKAGKKIEKLEERTDFYNETGKNVGRYSDIVRC